MINWNCRTYTKEEFTSAWIEEESIAAIARRLGLSIYGSTYKTIKQTATELGLPEIDRVGRGWSKGKNVTVVPPKPIEEWLVYGSKIGSYKLKQKLFRAGLLEEKCGNSYCGISEWHGKPVPLHLDHINGDNIDNRIENLRVLCMNCHGQTDTYCRGKGKKGLDENAKKRSDRRIPASTCIDCGTEIGKNAKRCKEHENERRRRDATDRNLVISWPDTDVLIERLSKESYRSLAKELGVSDNAIRKRLKARGIDPKTLCAVE